MGGKKPMKQMSRAQLMKKLTPAQRAKLTKLVERQKKTEAKADAAARDTQHLNAVIDKFIVKLERLEDKEARAFNKDDDAYMVLMEYEDAMRAHVRPVAKKVVKPFRGGKMSLGRRGWKGAKGRSR